MSVGWQLVPKITSWQERLAASLAPPATEIAAVAVNNGLEFPFVISLAINSNGDVFAGTFEGGGVYRSTDNGETWVEINHDDITVDVRALAINANGHIFAGTYAEVPLAAYSARQMMVIVGRR